VIRIDRGSEPASLSLIRTTKLAALSALGRAPTSDDVAGYKVVADNLWRSQHHKCCYCEQRVPRGFNDVEHYRPKCRADRRPGCTLTHGYWWLAFTWDNLLFACPGCNRSAKNDRSPLDQGSISLQGPACTPGSELPLLLDPGSSSNPVEHIEHVKKSIGGAGNPSHWWVRPRKGSIYGSITIDVCNLNRLELRELRQDHFRSTVAPQVKALNAALTELQRLAIKREFERALGLLEPGNTDVGFTYDAMRASIPDAKLISVLGSGWPAPDQVG
jgi:hypothetical protein